MHGTSHLLRAATATGATVAMSLTATNSSAQPASATTPIVTKQTRAQECQDLDMVYRPRNFYPTTLAGQRRFRLQKFRIQDAILCLVNAERSSQGLPALRLTPGALGQAASGHAADSVALRWWGRVTPGKNCVPATWDSSKCDPHINPQTRSTPQSRAQAEGYGAGCRQWWIGENAYVGWGRSQVTPRAAFKAWKESRGHWLNMVKPEHKEMRVAVASGSADPDAGSTRPALTYVQMFGGCEQ